jgi:clan AA aspartic protease
MISGIVSEELAATVRLTIRAPSGEEPELEVIVDTGFNGWISLPSAVVSQLGLPWSRRGMGELADGSAAIFDIYEGFIVWDGQLRRVWVDEIDAAPLLGMSLLGGHKLTIEAWAGGDVAITARE